MTAANLIPSGYFSLTPFFGQATYYQALFLLYFQ